MGVGSERVGSAYWSVVRRRDNDHAGVWRRVPEDRFRQDTLRSVRFVWPATIILANGQHYQYHQ